MTYEQNLVALAAAHPDLAREVAATALSRDAEAIQTARPGAPTLRVAGPGGPVLAYSGRDPVAEAERWAASALPAGTTLAVISGFGFGYPIRAVLGRLPPGGMVVAIEPRLDVLRLALAAVPDLHVLLRDPRLCVVGGASSDSRVRGAMDGALGRFIVSAARTAFLVPPAARVVAGWADGRVFEEFRRGVHAARGRLTYDSWDVVRGLDHLLANADAIAAAPSLAPLAGRFRGAPAVCVAAGPSLDHDIEALRAAPGRAVVLAADTALSRLMAEGIVPDAVVRYERTRAGVDLHLSRWGPDPRVRVVARGVVDPALFEAFGGRVMPVVSGADPWERWFADAIGGVPMLGDGLRSVAHLNLVLARFLGCDPVILAGQDLAYAPDGRAYGRGTAYGDGPAPDGGERIQVPANDGGTAWTTRRWVSFRDALAMEVARGLGRTLVTARHGARIAGTDLVDLADALAAHGSSGLSARAGQQHFHRRGTAAAFDLARVPDPGEAGRSVCSLVRAMDRVVEGCSGVLAALTRGRDAVEAARDAFSAIRKAPGRSEAVAAVDRVVAATIEAVPSDPFFMHLVMPQAVAARQMAVARVADGEGKAAVERLERFRRDALAAFMDLSAVLVRHRARLAARRWGHDEVVPTEAA